MPASATQQSMGDLFDKMLEKILKEGVDVVTPSGAVVHLNTLPPSYLNAIRGRLKDCGVTAADTPGSALDAVKKELEARGLKFNGSPVGPLNLEDDDLATGTHE